MTQTALAIETGALDPKRLREHEADFTPTPIVKQGLEWIRAWHEPRTIFDPCAGAGVFGMVAKELWPQALRFATDLRVEESLHLKRRYTEYRIEHWRRALDLRRVDFDLVATNPAFTEFVDIVDFFVSQSRLARCGVLMLLGLTDVMQRARKKVALLERCPPTTELRIAGPIKFRGPGINPETGKKWGADTRSYSWWIWNAADRTRPGDAWAAYQLPMLPANDRTWTVRPGTEDT